MPVDLQLFKICSVFASFHLLQKLFIVLLPTCAVLQIFSRFRKPFDAVLIDEACQAAEVAALQPLIHGTTKVGSVWWL